LRDIPEDDRTELSVIPLSENAAVTGRMISGKGTGQGAKEIVISRNFYVVFLGLRKSTKTTAKVKWHSSGG
jgi:hypothetical protein